MSKTKSTSRCRKWQLTINNPMEHEMEHKAIKEILNTFPSLVYWCMGDEIGNDTNTYHTHIYSPISLKPDKFAEVHKTLYSINRDNLSCLNKKK